MTLPAIDSLNTYGGAINDYRFPPDLTVERPKALENQAFASIAMATSTLVRAYCTFSCGSAASRIDHNAVWGNASGVAPTVTYVTTGIYEVTWPQTVTDALGASQSINLRHGWTSLEFGGPGFITANRLAAYQFVIETFNPSGSAADFGGGQLTLYVL